MSDLREHHLGLERLDRETGRRLPLEPVERCPGGHHRSDPIDSHLGQPGGEVAPEVDEDEVGAKVRQLHPSACRPGGYRGARREVVQTGTHQHVTRVAPLGKCAEDQTRDAQRVGRRKVLGRVHGSIGFSSGHGSLDLLDEDPLPPELRQRDVRAPVAFGVDDNGHGGHICGG